LDNFIELEAFDVRLDLHPERQMVGKLEREFLFFQSGGKNSSLALETFP